MTVFEAVTW